MSNQITVRGAREHNLKNISIDIPKNKLVVLTGLSGSGKSSFAFDTLYAEGQRRYVESLSSYARQFLGIMKKPDVESIDGLSPAISIDQKTVSHNPRSTVGTITEIYDYLRLLFARIGHPHCPTCGIEIAQQSVDQIYHQLLTVAQQKFLDPLTKRRGLRLYILAPVVRGRKGEFNNLLSSLNQKGFTRTRIDGRIFDLDEEISLLKNNKHTIEVIVDRVVIQYEDITSHTLPSSKPKAAALQARLIESLEQALKLSDGLAMAAIILDDSLDFPTNPTHFEDHLFSERFACPHCNLTLPELEPRLFSFNTPHGACPTCNGLGTLLKIDQDLILNPNLTIAEGGILPFNRMLESGNSWFFRVLFEVGQAHNFSLRTPIQNLDKAAVKLVLYGTGKQLYRVSHENREGRLHQFDAKYEGVIPNLERRYHETNSDYIRTEIENYMRKELCPLCHGARLREEALAVVVDHKTIVDITTVPIKESFAWVNSLVSRHSIQRGHQSPDTQDAPIKQAPTILSKKETAIASPILKELINRLGFLVSVGLDYLDLSRSASTLAGGEAQRIRLASQIGSGLSGVLYVLDEPSIGLHQRDNRQLIDTLKHLRDLDNTVIVVEHDMETMLEADYLIDFGPLAGQFGGEVIAQGTPQEIQQHDRSLTGQYLSGKKKIHITPRKVTHQDAYLELVGASSHNLKNLTLRLPLNKLICVTGVSGSGKSTLIDDTLYHALAQSLNPRHKDTPGSYRALHGVEHIKRVAMIDQSPIGRTPRSNPATYTKTFDHIRHLFAQTAEAKIRGYNPGRFSFNVKGGRCESCQGDGQIKIEMQFLPDVYVDCEVCKGLRYNYETLQVHYKGKTIADVLNLTVEDALKFFLHHRQIHVKLLTMYEVGLGYIRLGQPAPTLSGGEAQRIKLASELSKTSTINTVYLLDEPTTGLHFADLEKLLLVLKRLVDKGNTIIVIEHNLDLIKNADWIVDLGPEGGHGGGEIIAEGTPQNIIAEAKSWTGKYLKEVL